MARKRKFLIAGLIFLIAVGALSYVGIRSFFVPTYMVGQLVARGESIYGKTVQLEGAVVETGDQMAQIKQEYAKSQVVKFTLADHDNSQTTVTVECSPSVVIPDTFWANPGALVQGTLQKSGVFEATQVFTKCPSKYYAAPTPSPAA